VPPMVSCMQLLLRRSACASMLPACQPASLPACLPACQLFYLHTCISAYLPACPVHAVVGAATSCLKRRPRSAPTARWRLPLDASFISWLAGSCSSRSCRALAQQRSHSWVMGHGMHGSGSAHLSEKHLQASMPPTLLSVRCQQFFPCVPTAGSCSGQAQLPAAALLSVSSLHLCTSAYTASCLGLHMPLAPPTCETLDTFGLPSLNCDLPAC